MTLEEIYNISQYKNEKGCLLNMDCVEGTKMLPDSSIDLTITSPPYDNLRKYKMALLLILKIWQNNYLELQKREE